MNGFETMGEFFDKRSEIYDSHMKESDASFEQFYSSVSAGISNTQAKVKILDIGCGKAYLLFERCT